MVGFVRPDVRTSLRELPKLVEEIRLKFCTQPALVPVHSPCLFQVCGLRFDFSGTRGSRGATWSGQVISSPPGPSGGPFITHLLPGDGVPGVHGAKSPVSPRLPLFATPRSVCHLATVVAGAYPLRRPLYASWPGVPAPPGPCYRLVASGTPLGWRGGCLAVGLVRGTVCHYCFGGCSALVLCARRSRHVLGVGAGAGSRVSPVPPSLPPRSPCCVWRVLPSGCPLSSPAGTPFHVRSMCVPRARSGCPSGSPRVPRVWRAHLAWFQCRAPVGPFHAVRAPVPCAV